MKCLVAVLLINLVFCNDQHLLNHDLKNVLPLLKKSPSLLLSGDVNANNLIGNKNTTISNVRHNFINSNNTDHSTVVNRNSYNKISTIKKTGNLQKQINRGEILTGNRFTNGDDTRLKPHLNNTLFRKNLRDILHGSLVDKAFQSINVKHGERLQ